MSWSAITEAALLTRISGAELTALRAAALADGQDDPVSPSISQITAEVRGYVAACAKNLPLPTDATLIPDRLMTAACDMTVAAIIGRVPGYDLDANRQDRYDKAISLMHQVAACKFAIEDPDSGLDDGGLGVEQADSSTRQATRAKLDGL
jgi:hypothetical protein